jgi:cytochrome bd-type quinol oxidase subunit 1
MLLTEKLGQVYFFYMDKVFLVAGVLYSIVGFYVVFNDKAKRRHERYWLTASAISIMLLPTLILNFTCHKKEIVRHQLLKYEAGEIQIKTEDQMLLTFYPKKASLIGPSRKIEIPKECLTKRSGPFGVVYIKFDDCDS